ncbi:MAG: hypothetical protein ACRD4J_07865 [Nitrososphaeraceae archaeon]
MTITDFDIDGLGLSEVDQCILKLNHEGLSIKEISISLKTRYGIELSKSAVAYHLAELRQDPDNDVRINNECTVPRQPRQETRWYKIIERLAEAISDYERVHGFKPSSRTMYYQLIDEKMLTYEVADKTASLILLVKCYIISLFIPDIPQTILMLYGPQGTAKTSSEESIKDLVDPSPIPTLALPRDIIQLQQQLSHNYLAYYDNVSYITGEQSDQLSRASTGSGSSKRMLYSDDDDVLYWYIRGVGISAINIVATRPDLLDRGILASSATINEKEFKSIESYIKAERRRITPQLLGYIFDILVKVIRIKNSGGIKIDTKSRMVDFCEYGEIISRCMGNPDDAFTKAYSENIKRITNAALDSGIVAQVIIRFMDDRTEWDAHQASYTNTWNSLRTMR